MSTYNGQSDKLQNKINDISEQITELKKKKSTDASDTYDARITILTSQLALLNLELKKENKLTECIAQIKTKEETLRIVETNMAKFQYKMEEIRNVHLKLCKTFKDILSEWNEEEDMATKENDVEKCKELLLSIEIFEKQKNTFKISIINYKKRLEEHVGFQSYINTLQFIRTDLVTIDAKNESLKANVEDHITCIQDLIQTEIQRNSVFECPVCQEKEVPIEDVFVISACGHKLCRPCAKMSLKNDIKQGNMPPACPSCKIDPCDKCPGGDPKLPSEKYCLISDVDYQTLLNDEEWTAYTKALMDVLLLNNPDNYVRCPADNCRNVVFKDSGEHYCICPECGYTWCSQCEVEWHADMTCEQYQSWKKENEAADEEFEKLKREGVIKQCPTCKVFGPKEEDYQCNKITCPHCRKYFCWLCGENLSNLNNPYEHFSDTKSKCYEKLYEGCAGH